MKEHKAMFSDLRQIPGRGLCGIRRMLFTYGIFYGIDDWGYKARYCFESYEAAKKSLADWTGIADPPGLWIKHFGTVSYSNPEWEKLQALLRK